MSTQQNKLAEIAAAIRAQEGSEAPIKASDFAARITAAQRARAAAKNWTIN